MVVVVVLEVELKSCGWGWMGVQESQVVGNRQTRMIAEDR